MENINEIKNILPHPLLKLTDSYIGESVTLDKEIYDDMINSYAKHIYEDWEDYDNINKVNLIIEKLKYSTDKSLIYDIFDAIVNKITETETKSIGRYFDKCEAFWGNVYDLLPICDVTLFVEKYGKFIIDSDYIDEYYECDDFEYKAGKLEEYAKSLNHD